MAQYLHTWTQYDYQGKYQEILHTAASQAPLPTTVGL